MRSSAMIRRGLAIFALSMPGLSVSAGTDFGTAEEAEAIATMMIEIVNAGGVDAGVAAMHDEKLPFATTALGVNLFDGSVLVADNGEPERVASDYAYTTDRQGTAIFPGLTEALSRGQTIQLRWYHYDTQEVYLFDCHGRSSELHDAHVMVCR